MHLLLERCRTSCVHEDEREDLLAWPCRRRKLELDRKLVLVLVHKRQQLHCRSSCEHEDEREDLLALPIHRS